MTVTATAAKFTLSKTSVPIGTVIFTVTNKGKLANNFKIAGKKTPLIAPGRAATLRVTFSKSGNYPYLSTVSGRGGMFSVRAAAVAPTPTVTPTTTTTPAVTTVGAVNTTVTVDMFDTGGPPRFKLSQTTMPSGMVTFVINSKCEGSCSFNLETVRAGVLLDPGKSETWTVALPPGTYFYHCDAAPQFMYGQFTVTP